MRAVENYTKRTGAGFIELQEAEQMTLGGILLHPERLLEVKAVLKLKDFRFDKHRLIYGAMLDMDKRDIAIDVYTLWCVIDDCGQLDKVGRASYLSYLCQIAWRC